MYILGSPIGLIRSIQKVIEKKQMQKLAQSINKSGKYPYRKY